MGVILPFQYGLIGPIAIPISTTHIPHTSRVGCRFPPGVFVLYAQSIYLRLYAVSALNRNKLDQVNSSPFMFRTFDTRIINEMVFVGES